MAVLILAKHDNAHLNDATAKTVTAAKAMGGDITVLVAGANAGAVAEAAAKLDGVAKVIHVEGAAYGHRLAEPLTDLVVSLAGGTATAPTAGPVGVWIGIIGGVALLALAVSLLVPALRSSSSDA